VGEMGKPFLFLFFLSQIEKKTKRSLVRKLTEVSSAKKVVFFSLIWKPLDVIIFVTSKTN
jgi:hypothetical protein